MGLAALTGVAWFAVLELDWSPWLALIGAAVASCSVLVPLRGLVPQVIARAALWASFVVGLCAASAGWNGGAGALLALPAGGALLVVSRVGRRLGGREPMMFYATVLAVADIGAHGLIAIFTLPEASSHGGLLFFPAIAIANLIGLACLRLARTPLPHVVLNALVVAGAVSDVAGVKGTVDVAIGVVALLQIVAAILAVGPAPSPAARQAALRWLRASIVVGMGIALVLGLLA